MNDKDVEGALDWSIDLISTIADGVSAFLDLLPPVVLGGLIVIISVIALWHWARSD